MASDIEKNIIERVALGDIFRRRARTTPKRVALVEQRGDRELTLTFEELNAQLNRFARALISLGLEKGDRVGLLGLNAIEYVVALYGCAKGGFVAVPVNPGLNQKDLIYILNHADVHTLVVDDQLIPLVSALKDKIPKVEHFISIPGTGQEIADPYVDFYDFINPHSDEEIEDVVIEDRDIFEILYTSGTTAEPKGVMISHLSVYIMSLSNSIENKIVGGATGTSFLPMFHCGQQTVVTSFLHVGGKTVIFRGFEPGMVLDAIDTHGINIIFAIPLMYRVLLDHPKIKESNLESVSVCIYVMTPMDQRTLEEGIDVFGAEFMLGTGQTEFFPSTNAFRGEWQKIKKGNYWGESSLTVDTAIMDDKGNLLPPGETGEIVWRGPAVMNGYLGNDEATAESRKFGWHHSGDIGYFDEDNLLVFLDRKKDMIKTGGENVPSIKVERAILSHPGVESVAVVGLPHERWIEAVTAIVVPMQETDVTEEDILALCKKELGGFEVPKKVIIAEELPKTITGKIRKNLVREQYSAAYRS